MFGLTGLLGRIVGALLYGVVTFIVLFIIGIIVALFNAQVGDFIEKWAAIVGLLVGLYFFFTGVKPVV